MRPLALATFFVALGAAGAARADLYTCVDAQGHKTVSDKSCAPDQSATRVYSTPKTPGPAPAPGAVAPPDPLSPQSLDEIRAM
ncbi:MAG TPA: DUF4124 domain-containing protein, partial [Nevskiaceae bacterium]|nr:DUF4124 domain-containing protein [Nevskiaceae bacterium]